MLIITTVPYFTVKKKKKSFFMFSHLYGLVLTGNVNRLLVEVRGMEVQHQHLDSEQLKR